MCCTISISPDLQHSHVPSRTFSIREVLHRRWWHPRRNFVFKRRPNRRTFGHFTLKYGAKLVASFLYPSKFSCWLAYFFPAVPAGIAHYAEKERTILLPSWLLRTVPSVPTQPRDCDSTSFHVPLGTILNMHGPFFGSPRRALYTRYVKRLSGGEKLCFRNLRLAML